MRSLVLRLKKALKLLTPPVIMAYRGYGNTRAVHVQGHILDDRLMYEAEKSDKRKKNLRGMLSRYLSTVIPDISVEIIFEGQRKVVKTDENGLFQTIFYFDTPLTRTGWLPVHYKVLDQLVEDEPNLEHTHEAFVTNENSDFGVISDVDDTILVSHATQFLRKMRLILTKNAKTRLPFAGVAEFYQALEHGENGHSNNPVFYVSSSEWNLYDFLEDFCDTRGIPKGPFMLQELKTGLADFFATGGGTHQHKAIKIKHLLDTFPDLNFILIGDSGQRDAALYTAIAQEYPERIKAIYIRDVSKKKSARKCFALPVHWKKPKSICSW